MLLKEHKTKLVEAYAQPWRKYHNGRHIVDMLRILSQNFDEFLPEEFDSIALAIWYHDYIYNIPPTIFGSNEFYSAEHMYQDGYVDPMAYGMIIATSEHFTGMKYDNPSVNFMLDIDILSFSLDYESFVQTNYNITEEYLHFLPYEDVIKGRREFLSSIVKNKSLTYRWFDDKHILEEKAYANLEQFLKEF